MNELILNGVILIVTIFVASFVVLPLALIVGIWAGRWLTFVNDKLHIIRPW